MCKRTRLAGNDSFKVDLCGCGAIHLTVGFVTLRLDPDAYRKLVAVLDEGARAIQADTVDRPAVH
jgi:hypothetical protein